MYASHFSTELLNVTRVSRTIMDKFEVFEKMGYFYFSMSKKDKVVFDILEQIEDETGSYCRVKFAFERFRTSCET